MFSQPLSPSDPGIKSAPPTSPALAGGFVATVPPRKPPEERSVVAIQLPSCI